MNQERLTGIVYLINTNTGMGLINHPDHPKAHAFSLSSAPAGIRTGWKVSFKSRLEAGHSKLWAEDLEQIPA